MVLRDALATVRQRLEQACRHANRDASAVTLVGVTKGVPLELVREAMGLGLRDFGENRVQEARAKIAAIDHQDVHWHFLGHLQRNKAKDAVGLFSVIHSVDRRELIIELARQALTQSRKPEVLIQVNVSGETTKFGCRAEDVDALARAIEEQPALRLGGLMTMAPFSSDAEASRPYFRHLREIRDRLAKALGRPPGELKLSMGMSQDFEVAIEEGADWVRVGTAIFGERHP